jgi:hypothetical protein
VVQGGGRATGPRDPEVVRGGAGAVPGGGAAAGAGGAAEVPADADGEAGEVMDQAMDQATGMDAAPDETVTRRLGMTRRAPGVHPVAQLLSLATDAPERLLRLRGAACREIRDALRRARTQEAAAIQLGCSGRTLRRWLLRYPELRIRNDSA